MQACEAFPLVKVWPLLSPEMTETLQRVPRFHRQRSVRGRAVGSIRTKAQCRDPDHSAATRAVSTCASRISLPMVFSVVSARDLASFGSAAKLPPMPADPPVATVSCMTVTTTTPPTDGNASYSRQRQWLAGCAGLVAAAGSVVFADSGSLSARLAQGTTLLALTVSLRSFIGLLASARIRIWAGFIAAIGIPLLFLGLGWWIGLPVKDSLPPNAPAVGLSLVVMAGLAVIDWRELHWNRSTATN